MFLMKTLQFGQNIFIAPNFETEQSHDQDQRVSVSVSRTVIFHGKFQGQISTEWVLTPRTSQGQACMKIRQVRPRHLWYAIQRYGRLVKLPIITRHTKGKEFFFP
jgi:hypothetical protein